MLKVPKRQPTPKPEPLPASDDEVARAARDDERRRVQQRSRYGASGSSLARETASSPSLASGGGLYSKDTLG